MISLDCETTGVDLHHSARPFFVTTCNEDGLQRFWEWFVDPLTRAPIIPESDLGALREILNPYNDECHGDRFGFIGQNFKFDVTALATIIPEVATDWMWEITQDTLLAGHLLASNQPHDLTSMAIQYLGIDITPFETRLEKACKKCRGMVQQAKLAVKRGKEPKSIAAWKIAEEGLGGMPSAGAGAGKAARGEEHDTKWKYDSWLPRAMAREMEYPVPDEDCTHLWNLESGLVCSKCNGHRWWVILSEYANTDSEITMMLWNAQEEELHRRKLWNIYEERRKLLRVAFGMEQRGVTVNGNHLDELLTLYRREIAKAERTCHSIANSYNYSLELPKGASPNRSLRTFMFDVLGVEKIRGKKSKTSAPTLDKEAMGQYSVTLPETSRAGVFVKTLLGKRSRDTAVTYLEAYKRFWLPLSGEISKKDGEILPWYCLHPSLNMTGSDTLRWSSSRPNSQNISKREIECNKCKGEGCKWCRFSGKNLRSLRYCFGPEPGMEWWSCDAKGIEDRLPAYKSGQQELIDIFERADDPPYYGSNHLLRFHTVYPDLWDQAVAEVGLDKAGPYCKKKYASSWYQWCKNGGFAIQYGAVDRAGGGGTADRAFHKNGAHTLLKERFSNLEQLNQQCIRHAEKYGYVETMPDKTVDPSRGYPLLCTRTEWGKILPTVPLSYYIQGTAMWWMGKAMIRCQELFDRWNDEEGYTGSQTRYGYNIALQIHDELVFSFPRSAISPKEDLMGKESNLWRVRLAMDAMAMGGDDIGIPTPVSCSYHTDNWAEGVDL